jgi:RHS repeat-associated protein
LELDGSGGLISYEEYHPYGTTAYQARTTAAEVSLKRYRYTGKERDEETGLYYHGARYYVPSLGRWISADPIGIDVGLNLFVYVDGMATRASDPSGCQRTDEERNAAVEVPTNERLKAAGEGLVFGGVMAGKVLYEMVSSGPVGTANAPQSSEEPLVRATTDTDLAMNFVAGAATNVFLGRVVLPIVATEIRAVAQTAKGSTASPKAPAVSAKARSSTSTVPKDLPEPSTPTAMSEGKVPPSATSEPTPAGSQRVGARLNKSGPGKPLDPNAARRLQLQAKKELNKTSIGRETLALTKGSNAPVKVDYTGDLPPPTVHDVKGLTDAGSGRSTIYVPNAQSKGDLAETAIHETSHALGLGGESTMAAEIIPEMRARMHTAELAGKRFELGDVWGIVNWVKRDYGDLPLEGSKEAVRELRAWRDFIGWRQY